MQRNYLHTLSCDVKARNKALFKDLKQFFTAPQNLEKLRTCFRESTLYQLSGDIDPETCVKIILYRFWQPITFDRVMAKSFIFVTISGIWV